MVFCSPCALSKERHLALPLLIGSIVLFYAGVAFAYYITLPAILHFFISVSPETVAPMTDINSYLSFCLKLFLVFGVTFEIPIATLLLILIGVVNTQSLAEKRRFIIVGCFCCNVYYSTRCDFNGDVSYSNVVTFEIGLLFGKILEKRKSQTAE